VPIRCDKSSRLETYITRNSPYSQNSPLRLPGRTRFVDTTNLGSPSGHGVILAMGKRRCRQTTCGGKSQSRWQIVDSMSFLSNQPGTPGGSHRGDESPSERTRSLDGGRIDPAKETADYNR